MASHWLWALAFATNSFAVALVFVYGEWNWVTWMNLGFAVCFGAILAKELGGPNG